MRFSSSVFLTSLLGWLAAGCTSSPYACSESSQCVDGDIAGVCQLSGYCSFPDEDCASGQRYGQQAGGGLSGACVPVDPNDTDTDQGDTTSASGSSTAPTSDAEATSLDAESSGEGCTPDCAGRECGDDGCGGTCAPGCADGAECLEDGSCTAACTSTWRVQHGSELGHVSLDGKGELLVTGMDGPEGLVSRVSTCDGQVLASGAVTQPGANSVRVTDAAATPTSVLVVGNTIRKDGKAREVFVAHLDGSDLAINALQVLPEPMQGAWSIEVPAPGSWWAAGAADLLLDSPEAWVAVGGNNVPTCGFPASPDSEAVWGMVLASALLDGFVYVAGSRDSQAYVAGFSPEACALDPCSCLPNWELEFQATGDGDEVQALIAADGALYAAGVGSSGPDTPSGGQGFIARIDPQTDGGGAIWTWDPSPQYDAILGLAHLDGTLYAAGVSGSAGGQAALLAMPLNALGALLWVTPIEDLVLADGVVAEDGALFVVGRESNEGWILRCTLDGECPR